VAVFLFARSMSTSEIVGAQNHLWNGIPLIDGCAAWLECKLAQVHEAGDHDICVGDVENAIKGAGEPLILWDRSFWSLR